MGLFGKKEKPEQPQQKTYTKWDSVWVNLTDKMLRVELEGDTASAGYTYIRGKEDRIQLVSRGVIFADVGKRGKAYKELEPYIGTAADEVEIEAKTGEYGDYYRLHLKFKSTVVEF